MAAPSVRGRTAPAAGLSATSPGGTLIGDAVIVFTWEQTGAGAPTHTLQSGFVELHSHLHDDGSTDGRLSVAYKIATADGANSYQAYTSSSGTTVRTGIIVLTKGTHSLGSTQKGAAASAGATQTNTAVPNPPSVTLGTARDWLVIPIAGWHLGSAATVTPTAPTNYSNLQHVSGSSASEVASSERALTAPASEDPGTYGDDVTPNGSAIVTIGLPSPLERTAAIDAVGAVTVAALFFTIFERAAAIDGSAAIATSGEVAAGAQTHERAVALAATADIASSATFFTIFERSSALGATADVSASGMFFTVFERTAAVDGAAAITSAPQRELLRQAALEATAGIASTFEHDHVRTADLTATASVAAAPQRDLQRAAALGATAILQTTAFVREHLRSAATSATATIQTGRQLEALRSSSLSATAAIESSGSVAAAGEFEAAASLTATAGIASAAIRGHVRATFLDATATITAAGEVAAPEPISYPTGSAPVLLKPSIPRVFQTAPVSTTVAFSGAAPTASGSQGRVQSPATPLVEV